MRRLSLTLLGTLTALLAVALPAGGAVGDGVLELKAVYGNVVVTGSRGVLWGQMDRGTLKVVNPIAGDGDVLVSGYEARIKPVASENTTFYIGNDLHFRVTGGKYKLVFTKGSDGIDLTAVGVGVAQLTGDQYADDTGHYALDGGKWKAVPLITLQVPFGTQIAPPPAPGPTTP
jgi:hypothetical protein